MSLTQHFKKLGAPLKNSRRSWGAVRASDNAVFLRVWQDQKIRIDGKSYMMLTHHNAYVGNEGSPGYKERLDHVRLAMAGARVYMTMCIVRDPAETPRKIKSFIEENVFLGGKIVEHEGDSWIEQAGRIDRFSISHM